MKRTRQRSSIVVGDREFRTQKELNEYSKKMIESVWPCESVREASLPVYHFLLELFKRHPSHESKIEGLIEIAVRTNPINHSTFELHLLKQPPYRNDNISYKKCGSGLQTSPIKAAMRNAVKTQIAVFKNGAVLQCEECKVSDTETCYDVDHVIQFEELYRGFRKECKLREPTEFNDDHCRIKCFRAEDSAYSDAWQTYHAEHADLRILCHSCNGHRKRYINPDKARK